jgi:hypothetical protein
VRGISVPLTAGTGMMIYGNVVDCGEHRAIFLQMAALRVF